MGNSLVQRLNIGIIAVFSVLLIFLIGMMLFPDLSFGAEEKVVPGEVLVRVVDGTAPLEVAQLAESVGATGYKKITSWQLYRFDFEKTVSVDEKIRKLRFNRLVQYAEPNRVMEVQ